MPDKFEAPDLLSWLVAQPPEPQWLIKDFLPKSSLCMLSGPRKRALKTWLGFDLSLLVATGIAQPGSILTAPPTGRRVLCLEEEGTGQDTRSRILKLLKARGLDPRTGEGAEGLKLLSQNYRFFHHPRVKLDNPVWVKTLRDYVKNEGIELVVLDAITYMTSGDENSKQDMQPVNDALFALRQVGAAVLYLVHTNKQSQREDADPDLDVRGSSVLLDAYDVHLALRRHSDDFINLLVRYRDFEEQRYKVYWEFKPDRVIGSLKPITAETEVADKLQVYAQQLIPIVEYNVGSLSKLFGVSQKEAAQLMNGLVKAGILVPSSSGTFTKRG